MAYSHGTQWDEILIKEKIMQVMKELNLETMPTQKMLKDVIGDTSLNNAIARSGGHMHWANKLGLEHLGIQTKLGREYETQCLLEIVSKFGFDVEQMNCNYPYDLIVNKNIKIDVKVSKLINNSYYSFNLEKNYPTCDLFVAYCVNETNIKTYIIPSAIISGLTQLTMGFGKSKYDIFVDKWEYITKYNDFYENIINNK